jgi:DNA-binding CsgD family transcriptional regulator
MLLLAAITVTGAIDLILDGPETWYSLHMIVEGLFLTLCLGTTVWLGRGWLLTYRYLAVLERSLDDHREERDAWRRRAETYLAGLGEAIDMQMRAWQLTPTERETALFLLKGYSHKQTAALTERSERTVRQHAVSVYRKSGLGGRAELSAFFLEDLLLPADSATTEASE